MDDLEARLLGLRATGAGDGRPPGTADGDSLRLAAPQAARWAGLRVGRALADGAPDAGLPALLDALCGPLEARLRAALAVQAHRPAARALALHGARMARRAVRQWAVPVLGAGVGQALLPLSGGALRDALAAVRRGGEGLGDDGVSDVLALAAAGDGAAGALLAAAAADRRAADGMGDVLDTLFHRSEARPSRARPYP